MTNVLCRLEVNHWEVLGKRKRPSLENTIAKKPKVVEKDLSDVMEIVNSKLGVVVATAGWRQTESLAAANIAAAAQANDLRKVTFSVDKEDLSGEISYELGLQKVPCIVIYSNGKKTKEITDFSSKETARTELQDAITVDPIPHVQSKEHFQSLVSRDTFTILDFFASWCAPCNRIKPRLPELQAVFPHTELLKIDRDALLEVHEQCGVQKIPTFQIYKSGQLVGSLQHSNYDLVKGFIDEHVTEMSFDDDF
eukprot:TRINITY_DN6287_c1_g6_i1.p1 TRINITY_DN6287_c1_g6~~TRINITY_DN6287_c1_g6_i1.p1  ORF type:complete len:262 (+),score=59.42 TRINITY_DN6287_c1_g6_i1:32-787(+)